MSKTSENIYFDTELPSDFLKFKEVIKILEDKGEVETEYKSLKIIMSRNHKENSIYVELHNGKKKKKYMRLKYETV